MKRRMNAGAKIYLALVLILMYLPMVIVVLYSFNANASRFPNEFTGFSLQYYKALFRDTKGLVEALGNSLILALLSCSASMVIGTLGALGMSKKKFRLHGLFETVTILPVMIPEIILGVAFLMLFTAAGLKFGMGTLVLSHVTFCTPYVYMLVKGRLAGMDDTLEAASRDLGASPAQTFFRVVLPQILPGMLSGTMLAFAMSLDDFVISFFVTGSNINTLPLKVYSSVKTGVSLQVNALCTLIMAAAFLIMGVSLFRPSRKNKTEVSK
ncbi:MAG: ABC transporter permease [Clostridia bacterium]|nr:ABC transporter permease [Clostridia bacterium]